MGVHLHYVGEEFSLQIRAGATILVRLALILSALAWVSPVAAQTVAPCDTCSIAPLIIPPLVNGAFPPSFSVPEPRSWHLLTQTYGGTISLLKDLTQRECEFAMHRAKGEPATDGEKAEADLIEKRDRERRATECKNTGDGIQFLTDGTSCQNGAVAGWSVGGMYSTSEGTIKSAECFR